MSFKCDICGIAQESGTKPIRFVTRTRRKVYPVRELDKIVIDNGGTGLEIVSEANACSERCVLLWLS